MNICGSFGGAFDYLGDTFKIKATFYDRVIFYFHGSTFYDLRSLIKISVGFLISTF